MNPLLPYRFRLIFLFLPFGLGTTSCYIHDTTPGSHEQVTTLSGRTMVRTTPATSDDFEKDFLHRMSDHLVTAMAFEQMGEMKTSIPQLRNIATSAREQQIEEIRSMETWSSAWYWHEIKPHIEATAQPDITELNARTGNDFGGEFIKVMMRHFQKGIELAGPAASNSPHEQTRLLAKKIMDEQKETIADFQKLLAKESIPK